MRRTLTLTIALLLVAALAPAQGQKKPLSPPATAEAKIDGKTITVNYSAPSMRGREIMGKLVPFGQVWRTGANAATTLTTDSALMIGNIHVAPGTYTLYTIPGEKEWTLIVNKQTGQWGTDYDETQDLARAKMSVTKLAEPLETFAIDVKPTSGKNGVLTLAWENTQVSVPIVVH